MPMQDYAREVGLVLGVTLVVNLLGTVWYHPRVFGGTFTALTKKHRKPGTLTAKYLSYILSFLLVVLLQALLYTFPKSHKEAYQLAASLCLFSLLANLPHHLYEEKPGQLFLVHWGYQVLYLASATTLLTGFGSKELPLYQRSTFSSFFQ